MTSAFVASVVFVCIALGLLLLAHLMRSDYLQGPVISSEGVANLRSYGFHPFLTLASMAAAGMSFAFALYSEQTSMVVMTAVTGVFCLAMHYESAYSIASQVLSALERERAVPTEIIAERDALKNTVAERDVTIANLKGQIEVLSKNSNIVSIERPAPRSTPATG